MNQTQALAFVRYIMALHGSVEGCALIANKLGIAWETVYAWHRRDAVPAWRLEALDRVKPAIIGAERAAAE